MSIFHKSLIFSRLFLNPYKKSLSLLLLFPIIWCLVESLAPYLIKTIIDHFSVLRFNLSEDSRLLIYAAFSYGMLMLGLEVATRLCHYCWIQTVPLIRADIQMKALDYIQARPLDFFYNESSGSLMSQYRDLGESFEKMLRIFFYGFYPTLLSFIFSFILIMHINLLFGLVFLGWFFSMVSITHFFLRDNTVLAKAQAGSHNRLLGYVGGFIGNAVVLLSFDRILSKDARFKQLVKDYKEATQNLEYVVLKADCCRSLASWVLLLSMIVFLTLAWKRAWISLGDFSFVSAICFYARRTLWSASVQLSDFFKEFGTFSEALSLVLNLNTQANDDLKKIFKGDLALQDIDFSYGKNTLLKNLKVHIPLGQKLGIAGPSGAGKTTFIYLILGLYRSVQGSILIDGQDYRHLPLKALNTLFSYVPQNVSLIQGSIFDNITLAKKNASQAEVEEAAGICLCASFIESLDQGYQTLVGEGGYKLSGGQRQRIAIASAYLKKAPVFILDEATSGLETSLEAQLLDNLLENLKDHTLIFVSHRSSALFKMDRVLKLQDGFLLEEKECSL